MKELRISHKELSNPHTITSVNERKFREAGLDMHVNEVVDLHDDFKTGERVLRVKDTKYFTVPELPWRRNGV